MHSHEDGSREKQTSDNRRGGEDEASQEGSGMNEAPST